MGEAVDLRRPQIESWSETSGLVLFGFQRVRWSLEVAEEEFRKEMVLASGEDYQTASWLWSV
jgi:hypothetical protein